ncbi:MAG: methyltransferase [Deltaproteobacteria bacterium]|nr:methyltransferase [Deltaproteobacteria bacterium]
MDSEFQVIKKELLQVDAALQGLAKDKIEKAPHEIYDVYLERLNRLAAAPVPDHVVRRLVTDGDLKPAIARISGLKRQNGLRLEIRCARSIMSDADPWAALQQFVYYPNYQALARMEYGGAGLHAGDRVVFLGSGPLPLSLICLSRQYGIEGVGLEQEEGRAALSRGVINKLGLRHHIQILCENHFSLPLREPCSLVMIGADALPKAEIFDHLAGILAPGQMISYRIYEKGLRRLFDVASAFDLPPEFRECGRVRPEPPVNNTSVFAVRRGWP